MSMASSLELLTPDRWEKALAVLNGEQPDLGISIRAAARAAGVRAQDLRAWVQRSREKHIDDETWVHEIADQFDSSSSEQAGLLEDIAFDHATNGVPTTVFVKGEREEVRKHNAQLLMRLLSARDDRYRSKVEGTIKLDMDADEVYTRFVAMMRLRAAQLEAVEGQVLDPTPVVGAQRLARLQGEEHEPPDPDEMYSKTND